MFLEMERGDVKGSSKSCELKGGIFFWMIRETRIIGKFVK